MDSNISLKTFSWKIVCNLFPMNEAITEQMLTYNNKSELFTPGTNVSLEVTESMLC